MDDQAENQDPEKQAEATIFEKIQQVNTNQISQTSQLRGLTEAVRYLRQLVDGTAPFKPDDAGKGSGVPPKPIPHKGMLESVLNWQDASQNKIYDLHRELEALALSLGSDPSFKELKRTSTQNTSL